MAHWWMQKVPVKAAVAFLLLQINHKMAMSQVPAAGRLCSNVSASTPKRFPPEWEEHLRTFLVWPASTSVWKSDLPGVRDDVAAIAKAIAKFEPVIVLARSDQVDNAEKVLDINRTTNIEVVPLPVDDLWARDTLPVFIESNGSVIGVDFHFNGWGNKQIHKNDQWVAAKVLEKYEITCVSSPLVGEGGALETDGEGTLLVTESSLVNKNRNPGKTRDQIEQELKDTLGVTKVIWFKGVKGEDITDAHVDAIVRFTSPGVVVINRPHPDTPPNIWSKASDEALEILQSETDAKGRNFTIVELPEPNVTKISGTGDEFLSSYVNYYVANGAVILPQFNDKEADDKAKEILQKLYPTRKMVQVEIDTLASGGGGIHCSTHDQPKI
jgi:agmatine deiminase